MKERIFNIRFIIVIGNPVLFAQQEVPGWVLEHLHAGWQSGASQEALVFKNKRRILWGNLNEASPRDGEQSESEKEWRPNASRPVRKEGDAPSATKFKDKIWIAGGTTTPLINDV